MMQNIRLFSLKRSCNKPKKLFLSPPEKVFYFERERKRERERERERETFVFVKFVFLRSKL